MSKFLFTRLVCPLIALTFFTVSSLHADRVWLEFTPGQKANLKKAVAQLGGQIHYEFDQLNAVAVSLPAAAIEGISRNPNVVLVELDPVREMFGQTVPYGIDKVQARDVWDADRNGRIDSRAPTGAGITVGVIDSGVFADHEDLGTVDIRGESGTPTDWFIDGCAHGTHVVGTIAAAHNQLGVVGVSPGDVSIYMVKVFGDDCIWAYSSTLVHAALRCQANGARIISMSLGGSGRSRTEERAFQKLSDEGVLSFAAAGNSGHRDTSYPAGYKSVISVAATDINNVVAGFSQKNRDVELAAPGVGVLSTWPYLTPKLTVDQVDYQANAIENAAPGTVSGPLVNGGRALSTNPDWNGKIVLVERGDITFNEKVQNVENSGGLAAVIYNNAPGNFSGTLGPGNSSTIPAISISQEDGQFLVQNKIGATATVDSPVLQIGSGYAHLDGTSMATPHASGVAALIWSAHPQKTNLQILEALQKTALDLGPAGRDTSYGFGLVQALNALEFLNSAP